MAGLLLRVRTERQARVRQEYLSICNLITFILPFKTREEEENPFLGD